MLNTYLSYAVPLQQWFVGLSTSNDRVRLVQHGYFWHSVALSDPEA
jgi:hypothetical protein